MYIHRNVDHEFHCCLKQVNYTPLISFNLNFKARVNPQNGTEIGVFHAAYISCIEYAGSQTCNTDIIQILFNSRTNLQGPEKSVQCPEISVNNLHKNQS